MIYLRFPDERRQIQPPFATLKPKKSFGQHFLHREDIARRIADSLTTTDGNILEVGPGKGMLTQFLLEKHPALRVVEADRDMVLFLRTHFPALEGRIFEADFLKVPLDQFMEQRPFAIIGNFPYNISSQIVFHMLKYRQWIPEMVGMFQKEMADRIVAQPGSKTYGVISVLSQAWYDGTLLFNVDKSAFVPPPKVQSAVIRLTRKPHDDLGCDVALFRQIVKQAFNQRRKMLRNTLKPFFPDQSLLDDRVFQQRPEQLSVADFVALTRQITGIRENKEGEI